MQLNSSIEVIQWLTFQGCALRGYDKSRYSGNRGNFLKLLKFLACQNEKVDAVVFDNAPPNASYTLPQIQKKILHVIATRIKKAIREEINDENFCITVDEARDEPKNEQMAIVLRFVDRDGFVCECFFGLVHVSNTTALTLK